MIKHEKMKLADEKRPRGIGTLSRLYSQRKYVSGRKK